VLVAALAGVSILSCSSGDEPERVRSGLEQLAMIPFASLGVGAGPGEVTIRRPIEGVEGAPGGPSAFAVGPRGELLVADQLAGRVVRLGRRGEPLSPLPAWGVEDVAFGPDGDVFAWTRATSTVTRFSEDGQELTAIEVPRTLRWVTGFTTWPGGGLGLHTAYQESAPLDAQDLRQELAEGVPGPGGERYRTVRRDGVASIEVLSPDAGAAPLRIAVPVRTRVGSLELVGATGDGEIVVDVQDVTGGAPVRVERAVRRYGPDGSPRGEVRVPRGLYAPAHALELGPDGTVYALVPTLDGVEVYAWPREASEGGAP
jgi:hypothetical protein